MESVLGYLWRSAISRFEQNQFEFIQKWSVKNGKTLRQTHYFTIANTVIGSLEGQEG